MQCKEDGKGQEVECDLCGKWVCWSCTKVDTKDKKIINKSEKIPGLLWTCEQCAGQITEIVKGSIEIRKRLEEEFEERKKRWLEKAVQGEIEEHIGKEKAEHEAQVDRKDQAIDHLKKKLEEKSLQLEEKNERLEESKVKEGKWLEEKEEMEFGRLATAKEMKDLKDKIKSGDAAAKKKDREQNRMKEEISQYSEKVQEMSEEEEYQKQINKTLVKRINDLEKIHERLEAAVAGEWEEDDSRANRSEEERRMNGRRNGRDRDEQTEHRERNQEKLCIKFAYGNACRFGTRCRFLHQRICYKYAANGNCRNGDNCQFSHDLSGRCKREESGECTFGGRCWYGHIWNTHRSDFDTYNRRTSERHAEARSRSNYDNHNSMYNRAGDERRNQEQPSHWNSSVQNQLDQYNYTSSGSNNSAGTLDKIGNQLTFLVKQMSGQQNGWIQNNANQRQLPQVTLPQYQQMVSQQIQQPVAVPPLVNQQQQQVPITPGQ